MFREQTRRSPGHTADSRCLGACRGHGASWVPAGARMAGGWGLPTHCCPRESHCSVCVTHPLSPVPGSLSPGRRSALDRLHDGCPSCHTAGGGVRAAGRLGSRLGLGRGSRLSHPKHPRRVPSAPPASAPLGTGLLSGGSPGPTAGPAWVGGAWCQAAAARAGPRPRAPPPCTARGRR